MGYQRVDDGSALIIRLLQENDGFLPFHDKSDPDEIYDTFSMSKKTFKMTIGNLYKSKLISISEKGIHWIGN
jgi:predicted RNA-binding protein (virulence factor B family)